MVSHIFKMPDKDTVNKVLLNNYGRDLSDRPWFRVVWSNDQLEKRRGTFNTFTECGIFVRTVTEVREVPKYPYIADRWILETLVPPSQINLIDLPEARQGSYEPIYVFEDSKGNALPLNVRVVELVADHVRMPKDHSGIRQRIESEFAHKDEDEINFHMDAAEVSTICNQLHQGEAIIRP